MQTKDGKRKARSPYQKYGKTPFRYSEAFYRWHTAVVRGDDKAADAARFEHAAYVRRLYPHIPAKAAA